MMVALSTTVKAASKLEGTPFPILASCLGHDSRTVGLRRSLVSGMIDATPPIGVAWSPLGSLAVRSVRERLLNVRDIHEYS